MFKGSRWSWLWCALVVGACDRSVELETAQQALTCGSSTLQGHTVVCDGSGLLLAWPASPNNLDKAYDYVLGIDNSYFLGLPTTTARDLSGAHPLSEPIYYSSSYVCSGISPGCTPANSPAGWPSNGAGLAGMMADAAFAYDAYTGDRRLTTALLAYLQWHLDHGLTLATDSWQSVPYSSGEAGLYDFRGADYGNTSGVGDGRGYLEPEKVAAVGYALIRAWEYDATRPQFRAAAVHIANQMFAHQALSGLSSSVSPWYFRATAAGNVPRAAAGERYASNVVDPLVLYSELIKLGNAGALDGVTEYSAAALANWQTGKASALAWVLGATGPLQDADHNWSEYFEDVGIQSDLGAQNQLVPMQLAKYLLDHPADDPSYLTHTSQLLAWVESTFGDSAVNGAIPIKEQQAFPFAMGSHTSRWASVHARYYELTGNATSLGKAYRGLNWATYNVQANGMGLDGPQVNNVWFTDGWTDLIRNFMFALGAVPDWAPSGQSHLVRSSSVVKTVAYAAGTVGYTTYDAASREVLRLSFTPTAVTAGGVALPSGVDLDQAQGWTWDTSTDMFGNPRRVLRIRHDGSGTIVITGSTSAPQIAITSPTANQNFAAPATLALSANVTPSSGRSIPSGGVKFYNGATLLCTTAQTASPFSCTAASALGDGSYVLTATATDSTGESNSASVTATVSGAPTVAITSPASGATLGAGSNTLYAAVTVGTGRSIASIVFKDAANTTLCATTTSQSCVWTAAVGSYTITATVTDTGSPARTATSSPVDVTVSSSGNATVLLGSRPDPLPPTSDFEDPQTVDYWKLTASAAGTPATLNVFVDATNTATSIKLGIYSDTANAPGTLVTACTATATAGIAGWISCNAGTGSLTSGASYWFAILAPTANQRVHWREQSAASGSYAHSAGSITTLATTAAAVTGTYPGNGIAAYAASSGQTSTPPAVVMTAPAANANFAAPSNTTLAATATPSSGRTITKVEFFTNGSTLLCTVTNPSTIAVNCGVTLSDGTYVVTATATDDLAQRATSSAVTFTASRAPSVALTAPADGSTVAAGNVALTATATAGTGRSIAAVAFKSGATTLCTATASPWTCTWTGATAGSWTLTAVATDTGSPALQTTSAAIAITVSSSGGGGATLLGSSAIQTGADFLGPGEAEAFQVTASAAGSLATLKFYVDPAFSALPSTLELGVYGNTSGSPGTLLGRCLVSAPATGWISCAVSSIAITAGTVYWLAILNPTGSGQTIHFRDAAAGAAGSSKGLAGSASALPASWTVSGSWPSAPASFYGTN